MRVSVRWTISMPSLVTKSSVGVRLSNKASGVDSQCVAFCSSPNTATACAMTGTRRARGSAEVIRSLFYLWEGFFRVLPAEDRKTSNALENRSARLPARRKVALIFGQVIVRAAISVEGRTRSAGGPGLVLRCRRGWAWKIKDVCYRSSVNCGAIKSRNSLGVTILMLSKRSGKCLVLPVMM
jgi:hypothetical protein